MWVIPNTNVTVMRGSAVDEYSGAVTSETAYASNVTASITEQSRTVTEPTTGMPRNIRMVTGRVPDGTGIRNNDKIVDNVKGCSYWVVSVRQHTNPYYTSEEILDLKRIDSTDP